MTTRVEVLNRGRFFPVVDAIATYVSANAWQIRIPVDSPIHRKVRRKPTPEGWDEAVFLIDDQESQPAMGSGLERGHVKIHVLIL